MRLAKIMLTSLVLGGVIVLASSCASNSTPAAESQVVTVQRGDLSTDITGVGNLALSQKIDLAFEIDGTVAEVMVEEGQSVAENQTLVRLDDTDWEAHIVDLEDAVTAAQRNETAKERAVTGAQRNVTNAEHNVTTAERNVTTAERNVTSKKLDLLQAQINLNNAELSLEQTEETSTDPLEIQVKRLQVEMAKGKLADAQQAVDDAETEGIADAQQAVEDAKLKLEDAQTAVEDAQVAVADAQKSLADAQKALDDAKSASPEVKAPFAGFITKVNVVGGDEVTKGTVAVTVADPNKFEADIMVSEADILKVKQDSDAMVQVEATQGVSLPAKVTHISPTAVIQQGVVNYAVKVEIQSLQPVTTQRQPATAATGNVTPGASSGRFGQAFGSGNLTQEQINQMIQQRQQARTGQPGGQRSQAPGAPVQGIHLAEGMTVTVSIIVEQKNSVLMVPTQAIISRGGATYVQVAGGAATEERAVQTGISNWQYTEITGGLSEGDQIMVPQNTAATSTTTQQRQPQPPGGLVPGVQRMLR